MFLYTPCMTKAPHAVPAPITVRDAIDTSDMLRALMLRQRQSEDRLRVVCTVLSSELQCQVRAGGLDSDRWTLMADDSATAAKLRQLLPRLQAVLSAEGLAEPPVNIRVRPR
jgi:hypothetical protein